MRQPRGLTCPNGSSSCASPARRHESLNGTLAKTSSGGHEAHDDEICLRQLAHRTATNRPVTRVDGTAVARIGRGRDLVLLL